MWRKEIQKKNRSRVKQIRTEYLIFSKDQFNIETVFFAKLRKRIQQFGMKEPIRVLKLDDENYLVENGHHRLAVAIQLGLEFCPCLVSYLD
jgi:ParB-like chromosome segregation protein Spo0J